MASSTFQPAPTYADVILVDKNDPRSATFNPIWLKWFLDIVQVIDASGGGSGAVQHNDTGNIQGGEANQYYHLTATEHTNLQSLSNVSAALVTLAGEEIQLTALAGDSTELTTLAGIESTLSTLAAEEPALTALAGDQTELSSLAAVSSELVTLAGEESDISALVAGTVGLAPSKLDGTAQANRIYMQSGVPDNGDGLNGDFCYRSDGTLGTLLYHKESNTWVAVL